MIVDALLFAAATLRRAADTLDDAGRACARAAAAIDDPLSCLDMRGREPADAVIDEVDGARFEAVFGSEVEPAAGDADECACGAGLYPLCVRCDLPRS